MAEPLFTIAVTHTVNLNSPAIAQAILGGFQQMALQLADMENRIMAELQDLQAKVQQLVEANQAQLAQITEGNTKTDALIAQNGQLVIVATATKDALVAARDEIARLQAAQGAATAADLVALTQQIDGAIALAQSGIAEANAQDVETDAATAATGTAATNVAP